MARSSKAVGRIRAHGPSHAKSGPSHAKRYPAPGAKHDNDAINVAGLASGRGARMASGSCRALQEPLPSKDAAEGDSRSSAGAARADPGDTGLAQKRAFDRRRRRSPTAFARSDVAGSGRRSRWPHLPQVRHGRASGEGFGPSRAPHEHEAQSDRRSQELIDRPAPWARSNIPGCWGAIARPPSFFVSPKSHGRRSPRSCRRQVTSGGRPILSL